ncbi:MAG: helix-turn-helix domain-containing protein [Clostridia bacterium]
MDDSVLTYKDYGDIAFDIKSIMDKKGFTVTGMVKRTGLHHRVIRKYYEGTAVRYDKEVLAKLCYVLGCELSDIMYYKKPKN